MKNKLKVNVGKLSIILIAVFALLVAADLLTKYFEEVYAWNLVIINENFIKIQGGFHNQGCAFSILNDNPEIGQPILITFTFVMLAALVFAFIVLPERFTLLKVALTLVCAGAVGNLADRIMFFYVRDWFGLNMFGSMTFCNFADFYIVIGTVIAVIDLLFLNEWAVFPLTAKAKAVQKAKAEEEERKKAEADNSVASREGNDAEDIAESCTEEKNEMQDGENGTDGGNGN